MSPATASPQARHTGSSPEGEPDDRVRQEADGSAVREGWRGVAGEHLEDRSEATGLALQARSRALLWDLLRPHKRLVWLLCLVVVVENLARLAVPTLVQRGIDHGVPPLVAHQGNAALGQVLTLLVVALVVQATTRIFFLSRSGRIGQDVLLELRRRVFSHFQRLDVQFHDRYTSGRVVSRMTSDVEAIQELLATGFDGLVNAVLTMVGTAILLVLLDLRLGALCLLAFPPLLLVLRWFSLASTRSYRTVREASALVIVQFVETTTGIRAVQAYRREPRNQEIFGEVADRYRDANTDAFRLIAIFMPAVRLTGNLTIAMVLLYGGWRVMQGEMTVGVLAAFLLYLRMFFEPMQEISQFYNTFQSASAALEKLSGVLEEQPTVVEPTDPTPLGRAHGAVRLDRVRFGYDPERPVLPGLDLDIPAGQTLALVGTTGAGKTTIAKLVARFYDPTAGAVRLDGTDLRDLADADLRRNVVMVTQENVIFEGSVADNIGFGRPGATREQIEQAARAVGADAFVAGLPAGYDTDLGKRGGRLSAGQRQLVAFARAFLADPAVLILDEATSSLDVPSEQLVQRALRTILADRTAIIIAHRLSTVAIADRVLVLEHGQVVEDGSPAELAGSGQGRYAALHQAWRDSLA
ncbi:ABC transporter ATP-binding protein [Arsenicicoccus dermatophilus]|uniref:ABC transporter ATP-binding protein n=1 Tax=Arsenicicoccus dermatophilus TaxID=1076331 RepID=UPI003916EDAD